MDEMNPYLERIIIRYGSSLVVLLIIILVGFVLSRFRSSKSDESTSAKNYNYGKEPMSSDENIGEISMRLGDDVREVWGKGYSDDQINGVLTEKYTLDDLYKMKPDGNNRT